MQHLPQLAGRPMVTDGGLETDLIFNHGVELEEFAAYPLLWDAAGRALLTDYYDGYASIAARAGAGLLLESPTWRANRDWGARLGHSTTDLDRANADAVDLLRSLRRRYAAELGLQDVVVVGVVGPRGDGYRSAGAPNPAEAADYHHAQVAAFAEAGVDVVTAYTLTTAGEAIGITQSCREQGLPVAISFTVEVDGRLPDGTTLAETISEVDDREAPDYYLVNCAHPEHVLAGLDADDAERLAQQAARAALQRVDAQSCGARRRRRPGRGRPRDDLGRTRPGGRTSPGCHRGRRVLWHRRLSRRTALGRRSTRRRPRPPALIGATAPARPAGRGGPWETTGWPVRSARAARRGSHVRSGRAVRCDVSASPGGDLGPVTPEDVPQAGDHHHGDQDETHRPGQVEQGRHDERAQCRAHRRRQARAAVPAPRIERAGRGPPGRRRGPPGRALRRTPRRPGRALPARAAGAARCLPRRHDPLLVEAPPSGQSADGNPVTGRGPSSRAGADRRRRTSRGGTGSRSGAHSRPPRRTSHRGAPT